ncbi:ABC transporter, ATP-binding protein [Fannyhessea vaginae DSM 15829]|uniref:ABC transporter, ATP-binding protein n=3 Tax=Fannyhessea vaginae TaxID=82135 RepID=F1T698_9ACTN|nr:ABC transporter, ATP-binding protein [Fannyhessea vaginae DSM 15829]
MTFNEIHAHRSFGVGMFYMLKRFVMPYRLQALCGMTGKAVEVIFEVITPYFVMRLIDEGIMGHSFTVCMYYGAWLVAAAGISYGATLICQSVAAQVSVNVACDVRRELFSEISTLPLLSLHKFSTSTLVNRSITDVNQIQLMIALAIRQLIRCPLLAIASIVSALILNWRYGLIFCICIPLVALIFAWAIQRLSRMFTLLQRTLDTLSDHVLQNLELVELVRAYRTQKIEMQRFENDHQHYTQLLEATSRISALLSPVTFGIMNMGIMMLMYVASLRGYALFSMFNISQGTLVALINYMTQTLLAIVYISNLMLVFTKASAASARVMEICTCKDSTSADHALAADALVDASVSTNAQYVLEHVSFTYNPCSCTSTQAAGTKGACLCGVSKDKESTAEEGFALTDITCTIPAHGFIGVVGSVGSGKSTLLALLAQLYAPQKGVIRFGGYDLSQLSSNVCSQNICYVPQTTELLQTSIRDFISLGNDTLTDADINNALKQACAFDFVRSLDKGVDTFVTHGSAQMSGGQKQRLALARAFASRASHILLDDSLSALDALTEQKVAQHLLNRAKQSCVMLVSQQISHVKCADMTLVLDKGHLVGVGTHAELLQSCKVYQELYETQHAYTRE